MTSELRVAGPLHDLQPITTVERSRTEVTVTGTILDRLYFAVRDKDWATVAFRTTVELDGTHDDEAQMRCTGRTTDPAVPVRFQLDLRLTPSTLLLTAAWEAEADLQLNRIGFCLLHPHDLAGDDLRVESRGGTTPAAFPDRIAPQAPFTDIEGLGYRVAGADVDLRFDGDAFEMEDQRNWIDASFKTYSRPLRLPTPWTMRRGDGATQSVRLSVTPVEDPHLQSTPGSAAERSSTQQTRPDFGIGASRGGPPLNRSGTQLISALAPDWLAVTLLLDRDWRPRWQNAVDEAAQLGVPMDVTLVGDPDRVTDWRPRRRPELPIVRIQAYTLDTHVTTYALVTAARRLRDQHGWLADASVAGGSRANFAELGRATDLPLALLDEVVFAANPQVHAGDEVSIAQTPAALATAVRDARRLAGGRPVVIGPLTFTPVFNAVARDPAAQVDVPADPRQHTATAGSWAAAALRATDADGITLYECAGPWGLLGPDQEPTAAYHAVLAVRPPH